MKQLAEAQRADEEKRHPSNCIMRRPLDFSMALPVTLQWSHVVRGRFLVGPSHFSHHTQDKEGGRKTLQPSRSRGSRKNARLGKARMTGTRRR